MKYCINIIFSHTELSRDYTGKRNYEFSLELYLSPYSKYLSPLPLYHAFYPCHLEKAVAPHSSTLAWKIPWMEEPSRLQSMGPLRVGHD